MFKKWCEQQKFNSNTNLSHVLMDGGRLTVPSDKLNDFYEMCVKCIRDGESIFVVEQKTEIYNFFVDLDYKADEALSFGTIETISKLICDKVKSLGGGECLISVSKPKPSGDKVKSGVHLNWQNFPVDKPNALYLRSHIINVLTTMLPSFEWDKIVDKAVYGSIENETNGSGFRMPWSHKKTRHTECKGQGCLVCGTSGKITEPPYLPVLMYIDGSLEIIDFTEPSVKTLLSATVRSSAVESVHIPVPLNVNVENVKRREKQPATLIENMELISFLEKFIQKNFSCQVNTKLIKISENKSKYFSLSSTSQYCENVKREHTSNHVWFSIFDGKITQKCFDECCTGFTGRAYMLSPSILKLLYPHSNANTFIGSGFNGSVVSSKRRVR